MDPKNENERMTRRQFGKAVALSAVAAGSGLGGTLVAAPAAAEESDALVTDIAANASIIASLKYVNESPKPDQQCSNCMLYTGPAEGLGKCQVFQRGKVPAKAWCQSWVAKPQ